MGIMANNQVLLDRKKIVDGLNDIGAVARETLKRTAIIRLYGGAALILASNFRKTTYDIDYDTNRLRPKPEFMAADRIDNPENLFLLAASEIARRKHHYGEGWFNSEVTKTFSPAFDHNELVNHESIGCFPPEKPGLEVYVPSLEYILAMKLQASRITKSDYFKDLRDLLHLLRIKSDEIKNPQDLIQIHARFYRPFKRRWDFDARIEQLWQYHRGGDLPHAVRKAGPLVAAPRYLSHGCGST
jgi:hypothetical protein